VKKMSLKLKLLLGGAPVIGFLAIAGQSFAAVPVADPTVVAATSDTITGLQQAGTSNLATLIPIAAVLLISVAVVFFVIRHFRAIVHA
jgi:hypothetical protein